MHFFRKTFLPKIAPVLSLGLVVLLASMPLIVSAQAETAGGVAADIFSFTDPVSWLASLGVIILSLTGVILALSGSLLNYAVAELVLTMGEKINDISTIQSTWTVLRDFANVFFVFVLLFIGIATILNVSKYGYKSLARNLIIAAILVNFSLFFAQIIIDTSNLLAKEVFGLINIESTTDPRAEEFVNDGISGAFMYQLDLVSLYETSSSSALPSGGEISNEKIILITLFGSIFFIIASFIFLAAAFLLITRFVYLLMLMILSPIVFAAWVLPETKKYWTKWWDKLLQQSFFAPAYLFLVYVSLKVMEGFKAGGVTAGVDSGTFAQAIAGDGVGGGEIILNFFVVAAFMVMSIVLAQMFGAYGASGTIKLGKSLRNRAIGATTRTAGFATLGAGGLVGRATLGKAADRLARSERFQELAGRSRFGSLALRATRGVSTASFDARNFGSVQTLAKGANVDIGRGRGTGGAVNARQTKTENLVNFAQSLDRSAAGREAFAARRANKLMSRGGSQNSSNSLFGIAGRHNRVAAARILGTRIQEMRAERGQLIGETNQLNQQRNRLAATGAPIPAATTARIDQIDNVEIPRIDNEITRMEGIVAGLGLNQTQQQQY